MSSGEPHWSVGSDPRELFSAYLDHYREKAAQKLLGLTADQQLGSTVPSGWTPLELVNHLAYMERRWFVWGFLAEHVDDPVGDEQEGRWVVPEDHDAAYVVARLRATGERTRAVLAEHPLETVAAVGGRFSADPPTLSWICFHVLQEYARHLGHLDVAVELVGGPTGE